MDVLIAIYRYYLLHVVPSWPTIIPLLLLAGGAVWFFAVYLKGNFRWLSAWAIARVTVLDSAGRLEVIFLLLIGMLMIGVFEFTLFSPMTRNILLNEGVIQNYIAGRLGDTGLVLPQYENEVLLADILGMAALFFGEFFVALIGFVLSMFLLPNEINRGVILSILPKPITRSEYIFGKFFGTWIIVTGCFVVLALELYLIEFIWFAMHQGQEFVWFNMQSHFPINVPLLRAILLFPLKYATLILVIMWLTLRMPEAPAGIIGLAIFITGHFSDRIYEMSRDLMTPNPMVAYSLKFGYWMMPHLTEALSLTILDLDATLLGDPSVFWGWIWQIVAYNAVLLWLLILFFRKRSY